MKYLERQIDKEFEAWKSSVEHKPLLVRGARQVGKSSAIRHLGESFPYFLEVNFERDKTVKEFFDGDLNVKFISEQLSAYFKVPVIPGKTLLFLDEIQACPNAIHSLWFFKEDYPELHVVAAGSLLEFALKDLGAYGVGRIRSMFVYPMSFDEFLYALGDDGLVSMKRNATSQKPLMNVFYERLVERFRSFLLIGGMPAAVAKYVDTNSYLEVDSVLSELKQTYLDDFVKYKAKVNPVCCVKHCLVWLIKWGVNSCLAKWKGDIRLRKSRMLWRCLEMLVSLYLYGILRQWHSAWCRD